MIETIYFTYKYLYFHFKNTKLRRESRGNIVVFCLPCFRITTQILEETAELALPYFHVTTQILEESGFFFPCFHITTQLLKY